MLLRYFLFFKFNGNGGKKSINGIKHPDSGTQGRFEKAIKGLYFTGLMTLKIHECIPGYASSGCRDAKTQTEQLELLSPQVCKSNYMHTLLSEKLNCPNSLGDHL